MKLRSLVLAAVVAAMIAGVAYVGQQNEAPGARMADAAQKLLASLTPEQKKQVMFPFDSKERTFWNFVPMQDRKTRKATRKGVPLEDMTKEQRRLMLELLATGTSKRGQRAAIIIMALESILHKLEGGKGSVRDPDWYFLTIFGTPSKSGNWGWRFEGHHLSLNYTIENGQVISATPCFFGANPATVMSGKKKGLRAIPRSEDLALKLFNSLTDEQKKIAHQKEHFPEPKQKSAEAQVGEPVGLAASKLNPKQRQVLAKLVKSYIDRLPPAIGATYIKQVRKAGFSKIHFAFSGEAKKDSPHTYRVYGPTFVIEFLNTQSDPAGNPANHIHSVWRELGGDFGL